MLSLLASSGGRTAVTAFSSNFSVTTDFVSSPDDDTSVFSTTPDDVAARTVIPPPDGSAFICRVGLSADTSCCTTCPLAVVTATAIVSPSIDNDTAEPEAFATRFPDARVMLIPGSLAEIELPCMTTGSSDSPGVVN